MSEKTAAGMMNQTIEKIKTLVDANTIIGTPIVADNVTVIPVSKVIYGFAAGGSDLPSKSQKELFGGGGGAGITIEPIGFLTITNGQAKLLPVNPPVTTIDRVVEMVPDTVNKVTNLVGGIIEKTKEKKAKLTPEEEADEIAKQAVEAINEAKE